jgi:DNA mismatch repair ATPase MutS
MAGVPEQVVTDAREQLDDRPKDTTVESDSASEPTVDSDIVARLRDVEMATMTPIEALNTLAELTDAVE